MAACLVVWSSMRSTTARSIGAAPIVRVAVLAGAAEKADAAWPMATLLALTPLLMTAGLLAWRWHDIPRRFPIHWGFDGRANGWASRSPLGVFGAPVCGILLVGALASMGMLMERFSHGFKGRSAVLRSMRGVLCGAAWLVSLLFCAVSGLAFVQEPMVVVPVVIAGTVVSSLVLVGFAASRGMQMPAEVRSAAQHTTEDRYWKAGGFVYCNRADGALLVPKRVGFGYMMNFSRPLSWLITGGIFLLALGLPVLLHTAMH